jgi:predicted acyl esterase
MVRFHCFVTQIAWKSEHSKGLEEKEGRMKMKKDWHELISQPRYRIKAEENVYVTMRDGVRLVVDIFRPDAPGKFPALLALSPYGKELQKLLLPPQPLDKSALWDGNIEAGDIDYIVSRGYVHVIGDLRGTGDSEGEYLGYNSKFEREDGYDLVEWIAQQPWCDGNVGMTGYSYYSEVQVAIASEQPPHLKAIYPTGMYSDLYRVAYPGGILCLFLYGLWDGRLGTSGLAPKKVVSAMMKNLSKEEFERRRKEVLSHPDIGRYPNTYHLLHYPQKNPPFFDLLLNPLNGPFYYERSSYTKFDKIRIPVYSIGAWTHFFNVVGQLSVYSGINSPHKKLMMHPPGLVDRPWRQGLDRVIRWYDHWLKGIDTGMMDEPPINIFVMGLNQWRYENEWPLARTRWTQFYLRSWGGLSPEPEKYNHEPDCFVQQPLYMSSETHSLKYLSPPMSEDLEVIGPVALYLFASIDTDDTNWIVELSDVDGHGREQLLGRGTLKASHRAIDKGKSQPWQPYHPHTSSEPVVPGEVYEYAIEIVPISNMFRVGHRIQLEIKSMVSPRDPENLIHYHPLLCSSRTTVHKIYRNKEFESHLLLPVIPKIQ